MNRCVEMLLFLRAKNSMSIQESYNEWAGQYDSNQNKTRDLEAFSLQENLGKIHFENCLEIGCGSGKNTEWLVQRSATITAVDFSQGMLDKAKEKIPSKHVNFIQADITNPWTFAANAAFDLVTFSLVLEHIKNLDLVFQQTNAVLKPGGYLYIGELHPFKQYLGSKARFESETGTTTLECYTHSISEYLQLSRKHGFVLEAFNEYLDEETSVPRILAMLFTKQR
ncbi:MAG: class I SAM-dependent methyltransferase [Ferruginibacter sp.]